MQPSTKKNPASMNSEERPIERTKAGIVDEVDITDINNTSEVKDFDEEHKALPSVELTEGTHTVHPHSVTNSASSLNNSTCSSGPCSTEEKQTRTFSVILQVCNPWSEVNRVKKEKKAKTPQNKQPGSITALPLLEQKAVAEEILTNYAEHSEVYYHDQYADVLSDDDKSIYESSPHYEKKVDVSVTMDTVNSTTCSPAATSSPSFSSSSSSSLPPSDTVAAGAAESSNITQDSKRTIHIIDQRPWSGAHKLVSDAAKANEGAYKGAGYNETGFETSSLLEKGAYRVNSKKSIISRDGYKQSYAGTYFCGILVVIVLIIVILFPLLATVGHTFDNKHRESIEVHEKLSEYIYPTLKAIRTHLVDPDTPESAHHKEAKNGELWDLVFSDEFNAVGRTFYPNMDQFWEGANINYAATKDLEWYDPDAATTSEGTLKLQMDVFNNHDLFYRSAMLQSWNKMCVTEGIIEISAKMPGSSYSSGLWPGLWMLGNLARPGYMATTDGVWPYSYNECDAGATANQSSPDGLSYLPGQRLSKCTCVGEDHPNIGHGRGAPEIDILEGAHSKGSEGSYGIASQTLQIAPFDLWYMPDYEFVEVHNASSSHIGNYLGTPFQEMLSVMSRIRENWYQHVVTKQNTTKALDNETYFHTFSTEYQSFNKNPQDNYCRFKLGDDPTSTVYGTALHPNGNVGWRDVPKEPMSLILNLGISPAWSDIQWNDIIFPIVFEIDYVRIYQPKGKTKITCEPKDYPTQEYIRNHWNAYNNPNLTSWEGAGYTFPKNKLTGKC
ncbi:hypothetical protein WICPIJ_000409 [Wickerhamomyces pijperi]|uniref:GH16 domain-containing protein n=1 Tax=Wickerhamomyces pijperi TaxID=599730 RepID=A0A9P8QH27_WICPI|nr:hypothetical protein WICPIJ_000409 [Wickerhamomyces pijperi]